MIMGLLAFIKLEKIETILAEVEKKLESMK
jgi:hypothetical protein